MQFISQYFKFCALKMKKIPIEIGTIQIKLGSKIHLVHNTVLNQASEQAMPKCLFPDNTENFVSSP